jgi:hypothetical protein
MSETAADLYRLAQCQILLDLYEARNGKPVKDIKQLEQWMQSKAGQTATANYMTEEGKIRLRPVLRLCRPA